MDRQGIDAIAQGVAYGGVVFGVYLLAERGAQFLDKLAERQRLRDGLRPLYANGTLTEKPTVFNAYRLIEDTTTLNALLDQDRISTS